MKSEKLSNVLGEIIYDLLFDISAGRGDEKIDAPATSQAKGAEQDCINELVQFWDGNSSVTRYFLFANILKKCTSNNDVLPEIAGILAGNYPEEQEAKLSSNSILASIKYYCNNETPAAPVTTPSVEDEINDVKESVDTKEIFKEQDKNPNYLVKTNEESDATKKKLEAIEVKKALAAERAAYNGK